MTSERFASSGMALPEYLALLEARADGLAVRLAEAEDLLREVLELATDGAGSPYGLVDIDTEAIRAFLATSEVAK